jgi:hypothetical protein
MGTLINFKLAIIENFPLPEVEDTSGRGETCGYKNKADEGLHTVHTDRKNYSNLRVVHNFKVLKNFIDKITTLTKFKKTNCTILNVKPRCFNKKHKLINR